MMRRLFALIAGVLLLAGCLVGSDEPPATPTPSVATATATATPKATPTPSPTATPTAIPTTPTPTASPTATPPPTPTATPGPLTRFDDGGYYIGSDVAPGRYRTLSDGDKCWWRIVDSKWNYMEGRRGAIIHLDPSDKHFQTRACGLWEPYAPLVSPGEPFGPGSLVVGEEIAPGRYRAEGTSESCVWARLGDFSGAELAQSKMLVVDILPSDTVFFSVGCGTWSGELAPEATPVRDFGDGTHIVGLDIAPGRYRAAHDTAGCEWSRLSGFGGGYDDLIANGRRAVVDIEPTDTGFVSTGCGSWSGELAPDTAPVRDFGGGTHIVGLDIAPGRYRAAHYTAGCGWARLSGFGGAAEDLIANGRTVVVEIEPTDTGFFSGSCGEWRPWTPTSFEDGDHRVGVEVLPGRYRAVAPSEECSWSVSPLEPEPVASGKESDAARASITLPLTVADIDPSDKRFTSEGCGTWSEVLAPVATLGEPFGDGTYIVGLDIAPGRYRASDPSVSCFWLRLSDFRIFDWGYDMYGHTDIRSTLGRVWGSTVLGGDISTVVDIQPGDAGFYSEGCGTWSDDLGPTVEPGQSFDGGTFIVGVEVAPGRYRAQTPSDSCYWFRLSDFLGEYGETRHGWDGRRSDRTSIADIDAEDAGFYSSGCGTWSDDLSPIVAPGQPFPDGTYIVGVDIEPGRYRTTDSTHVNEECSWLRLYDFGGTRGAYEGLYATSRGWDPIADIDRSDVGFTSRGCGTWSSELTPVRTPGESLGDGVYIVGVDIEPGRYRAYAPSRTCGWARLDGFGGGDTYEGASFDIIGHSLVRSEIAPHSKAYSAIVDIRPTDAGFWTYGCGEWTSKLTPIATPGESFGTGMYIVGLDIAPGHYRATLHPQRGCEWIRIGSFTGALYPEYPGSISTGTAPRSDDSAGPVIVEILPSDAGFYSTRGCLEWRPVVPDDE